MNKVILIGRIGKDPELKSTTGGNQVATTSLATSRRYIDKEGAKQEATTWHNIVAWGKTAEIMAQYAPKGKLVAVIGRIDNRSYDKDGEKKYISEIVVEELELLGGKSDATDKPAPTANDDDDGSGLPF